MRSTIMLVIVGNAFCFLSSFPWFLGSFLACPFVASFSDFVSCSLAGSFPGIILNKCEQFCSF